MSKFPIFQNLVINQQTGTKTHGPIAIDPHNCVSDKYLFKISRRLPASSSLDTQTMILILSHTFKLTHSLPNSLKIFPPTASPY